MQLLFMLGTLNSLAAIALILAGSIYLRHVLRRTWRKEPPNV